MHALARRARTFSLRALLIAVAAAAAPMLWVRSELNWISQRHRYYNQQNALRMADGRGGLGEAIHRHAPSRFAGRGPGLSWLFGEQALGIVHVRLNASEIDWRYRERGLFAVPASHPKIQRARQLFPEAGIVKVYCLDPPAHHTLSTTAR
jgi:hypothetical protein